MANRDLVELQNSMLTNQIKDYVDSFNREISSGEMQDEGSILHRLFSGMRDLFSRIGKPTMQIRRVSKLSPPSSDDINKTFLEVHNDTRTVSDQQRLIGEGLKRNFNYGLTERLRLRNKIRRVGEMLNDYVVLAKNTLKRYFVIQDTFVTDKQVDLSSVSNPATVDTENGVVTLQVTGRIHKTEDAKIVGEPTLNRSEASIGNFLVPYKKNILNKDKARDVIDNRPDEESDYGENWDLEFNIDPHADPDVMFDEKPNTWVEWQLINIPDDWKRKDNQLTKGYGMSYRDGTPIYAGERDKDTLRVSFTIRLNEPTLVNKIVLDPYFPPNSGLVYRVNEVATSLKNTSDFRSVFLDSGNYNQTLGGDPADNAADLERKNRSKYSDSGVWIFPSRKIKYIKVDLSCEESYDCTIAHIFWEREYDVVTTRKTKFLIFKVGEKTTREHIRERYEGGQIDRNKLKDFIKNYAVEGFIGGAVAGVLGLGLVGAAIMFVAGFLTTTSTTHEIENLKYKENYGLDLFDGWRWCIGIRNLAAYVDGYSQSSTLVTKNMHVQKPVSEVSLSVSELIPEEFFRDNIATKNNWIKYYLSFDDGKSWHRISPIEHSPVGVSEENFPNKVITVNTSISPDARIPNKTYVETDGASHFVKLMAEFSRPESSPDVSPILYDYQIRIVPKESEGV